MALTLSSHQQGNSITQALHAIETQISSGWMSHSAAVKTQPKFSLTYASLAHAHWLQSPLCQALDKAAKSVKEAFDAAEKALADARKSVVEKKEECKRKMSLKCDNCKSLKCKQAEKNCKGFLDEAGKWIGGVVDAAGKFSSDKI